MIDYTSAIRKEAEEHAVYFGHSGDEEKIAARIRVNNANVALGHVDYLKPFLPSQKILKGHISPETAYVVDDYPYGFRLRCRIRYWLEYKPSRGFRFMSQTTNPKKAGEAWNKPKASTYVTVAAVMTLTEDGHVDWHGLTDFSDAADAVRFQAAYSEGLTEADQKRLAEWIGLKTRYERWIAAARAAS